MTTYTRPAGIWRSVKYVTSQRFHARHWSRANQHSCTQKSSNSNPKKYVFCINLDRTTKITIQAKIFARFLRFQASLHLRFGPPLWRKRFHQGVHIIVLYSVIKSRQQRTCPTNASHSYSTQGGRCSHAHGTKSFKHKTQVGLAGAVLRRMGTEAGSNRPRITCIFCDLWGDGTTLGIAPHPPTPLTMVFSFLIDLS